MAYYRDPIPEAIDDIRRYLDNELRKLEDYSEGIDDTVSGLTTIEDWHEIGAVGEPAFENSWENFGGNHETAAFYKDPFGRVRMKGSIKTGASATPVFTLPVGYRPQAWLSFASTDGTSTDSAYAEIRDNGSVIAIGISASAYFALDNISFKV